MQKHDKRVPAVAARKLGLPCLLSLLLSITGACVTFADYGSSFEIRGKVVDSSTRRPLDGVAVYFRDISLSKPSGSRGEGGEFLCASDDGDFSHAFVRKWGRRYGPFSELRRKLGHLPEMKFGLDFRRNGYRTETRAIDYTRLPTQAGTRVINLGTIALRRNGPGGPGTDQDPLE